MCGPWAPSPHKLIEEPIFMSTNKYHYLYLKLRYLVYLEAIYLLFTTVLNGDSYWTWRLLLYTKVFSTI